MASARPSTTSTSTAPPIPTASSRAMKNGRGSFWRESIPQPCIGTPPRALLMAENSAWGRKSASAPTRSGRAGQWVWRSCPAINGSASATANCEFNQMTYPTSPVEAPGDRARFVRARLPEAGLFSGQNWRVSPDPFPLGPELAEQLQGLGRLLLQFNRSVNLLYRQTLTGKQPC